ncbi:hypothetical protein K469DRAFT_741192 [Zopfia rhizophila CBS 207.26]|uniref:Zn(2)-C6 fungal-type domain-containing protein n=1 Tax=Zopfia rhizophila CBS 207.26 TaxID=1314779 RepID=A0A6A6DQ65_9PEZI|nr:hypothetical protein K469DRAFT_741192 [Zopfia rhizophila CBS 207.26]
MTTKSKSYAGCWTCRLRHKKCDESLPVSEWMDNGERQHEMAQRAKAEVKSSANRRRSRRLIQSIARDMGDEESGTSSQLHRAPPSSSRSSAAFDTSFLTLSGTSSKATANNSRTDSTSQERPRAFQVPSIRTTASSESSTLSSLPVRNELELSFVMTYLDYVFPVLFPFYRPSILEGGRSWLLVLVMRNNGLFHTVISLASYFFSVVPVISGPAHQLCIVWTWEELQKQTDMAVKTVQRDIQDITRRGVRGDLLESAHLMESIVQLLSFEVIIALTENWQIHLNAALVLFEQIFQYYNTNQSSPNISVILEQMGHRSFVVDPSNPSLWNADQAAFRFFSAILLVDDIISSTSLERPPRLREYHPHLLANDLKPDQEVPLELEDFIGCQNWALLLVGEIAALDAWKKDMKKGGTLSTVQLVQRAGVLERGLDDGLARLDVLDPRQRRSSKPTGAIDVLAEYNLYNRQPCAPDVRTSFTRIWAHAARTYLLIVVSGWQPANPQVRNSVARTIDLFTGLASSGWLRTLAWPFCVTGCLAEEEQEPVFREMVSSMGALEMFGTMRQALSIMEHVWRNRTQIDADSWDLAACLRSLGHRVLLV